MALRLEKVNDQYGAEHRGAYARIMTLHVDREAKSASIIVGTWATPEQAERGDRTYQPLIVRTFSILPAKQPRHTETIDGNERIINPGAPSFDELFGSNESGWLAGVYAFLKTQPEFEGAADQ